MNSALKPVLTSPTSQNPPLTSQLNKPMHPQNTPATYGQPSTHMPSSLVNLPHNNPNVAHSHPNPAHQTNHYSLNVPNAPQLYSTNTPSAIPPSNHPVTSQSAGQTYTNKNVPFTGAYQPNLGHPPNNPLPPVSQNLPASQPALHPVEAASPEKPQSNGTSEAASPSKAEPQNHMSVPIPAPVPALRELSPQPPQPASPKVSEKESEAKAATPEPVQEPSKAIEEADTTPNVDVPVSDSAEISTDLPIEEAKSDKTDENIESSSTREEVEKESEEKQEVKENQELVENQEEKEDDEKDDDEKDNEEEEEEDEEVEEEEAAAQVTEEVEKFKEKEKAKTSPAPKAAPRTPTRKSKTPKSEVDSPKTPKVDSKASAVLKSPTVAGKSKRTRIRTQPYQSPLPEIEIITKISSSTPRSKANDDKLIVFYKNEFLAVRNSEGSFYICQAVQNIYKSSPKIRIRWLSQDKSEKSGEVYTPDFYDNTDFDCILTNLNLTRVDKGRFRLPPAEKERTDSILKRSLAVEKGEVTSPSLTEEHPDGIDVSLYKQESQLKKRKGTKRKALSALKSPAATTGTKTPDKSKVRKVTTAAKTPTAAIKKVIPKRTPLATVAKTRRPLPTPPTPTETRRVSTSSSRTDRAKRRSDSQTNTKVSPVVDQKKAKVLAKVARKGALNVSGKSPVATTSTAFTTTRNTKAAAKAVSSSPKVQNKATKTVSASVAPPPAATRKTKRSLRK